MLPNCAKETLTPKQEQVLIGTLLGDASLSPGRYKASFRVSHCGKDLGYIFWKYEQLKGMEPFHLKPYRVRTRRSMFLLRSRGCPTFTKLLRLFYPEGKKVAPIEVLEGLDPLGLAVWYMDDGYLGLKTRRCDGIPRYYIKLATCSFSLDENRMIQDWFKMKYGFEFRVCPWGKNYLLRLRKNNQVENFLEIVSPYVSQVKCMSRKLGGNHVCSPSNPSVLSTL